MSLFDFTGITVGLVFAGVAVYLGYCAASDYRRNNRIADAEKYRSPIGEPNPDAHHEPSRWAAPARPEVPADDGGEES